MLREGLLLTLWVPLPAPQGEAPREGGATHRVCRRMLTVLSLPTPSLPDLRPDSYCHGTLGRSFKKSVKLEME